MTIDTLAAFLVANLNPFIAARSTVAVPLTAITADQVATREYQLPAKKVGIFLDPQPETVEPLKIGRASV